MEILLLLLLLVVAGAFYLPEILRERTLDSPLDTVSDFHRGMNALALSTHHAEAGTGGENRGYYYSAYGQNEPEPYVRRSSYENSDDGYKEDFVPYPTNRARIQMENRRHRVIAILLIMELSAGIMALVPTLRWMVPVTVVLIVITAGYISLTILLPGRDGARR